MRVENWEISLPINYKVKPLVPIEAAVNLSTSLIGVSPLPIMSGWYLYPNNAPCTSVKFLRSGNL